MAKIAGPTLVIRVVPDEKSPIPEPQVLLTERDVTVPAVPAHLIWRKLPASEKFQMVSLEDKSSSGDVFKNIVVEKKKIECDFDPPAPDPASYPYVLTIKYTGDEYTTSTRGGPGEGRPVIRN